ncbi:DELLA protein GAI isoform X2 [Brachypodium distachyon]|uniref:DELLA protein GAI isoform X2 n=1 Tax=Brachypodium distachyon TaxID=15368 RepID=UPI000D0E21E3|nr:DELLA protein GAI isoform X2 [Brachypodium distachyon]|eukprot:XP_024310767.1 DELLA protein GAI isoform X2 [Brachypodium distachyon]
MCSRMGTLNCSDTTSSVKLQQQQGPTSPTASFSESNIVASSTDPDAIDALAGLQALRFDGDIDGEIQSPDLAMWESLFADQIGASGADFLMSSPRRDFSPLRDFMVSSPKRDYMVSSPKRDYMMSSPKRDYMMSSPKRDYMVSSPKREMGVSSPRRSTFSNLYSSTINQANQQSYMHGMEGSPQTQYSNLASQGNKGKSSPSPLHKVYINNVNAHSNSGKSNGPSSLSCSSSYAHGENLPLPSMDPFLEEYKEGYLAYQLPEKAGGSESARTTAPTSSQLPTLSECLAMPEPGYGDGDDDTAAAIVARAGIQVGGLQQTDHLYYASQFGAAEGSLSSLQHQMAKPEQWADSSSLHSMLGSVIQSEADQQEQDSGLQLVHLLLACADLVSKGDQPSALRHLHLLRRVASPLGDSMQRVASYFADALAARLALACPSSVVSPGGAPFPFPPSPDTLKIYQILYQACPYIKFAHFTANQAIFEAFQGEDRVHVVDLDILQGYQWPAFLQALAARPGGPPTLRLTGVGHPAAAVRETGRHLASLAASLRVPFEFHAAVADKLERLRPAALQRRVGEALAVNAVNRLHRVPGAHLAPLLSMIRDQAPKIMTLVEQEAGHNGPYFLGRFLEALHYYSAIFDSLDATFPADSAPRMKVEQCLLAPEIRNVVACEGAERVARHERLDRWRRIMEGRGFEAVPLSPAAVGQSQVLLGLYGAGDGYRLNEDKGCLLLGWQDRAIIGASAWRC